MSEAEKPSKGRKGDSEGSSDTKATSKGSDKDSSKASSAATTAQIRNAVATAVWLIAVVCAVLLAIGALFVVLDFNRDNALVKFFIDAADYVDIGQLKEFKPDGKSASAVHSAEVKTVLVNWGIAAVFYLVVGKILERLIRP